MATTGVQQATLTVWKFPTATHDPTLLTSNLSADQEKRLREAFAEEAG